MGCLSCSSNEDYELREPKKKYLIDSFFISKEVKTLESSIGTIMGQSGREELVRKHFVEGGSTSGQILYLVINGRHCSYDKVQDIYKLNPFTSETMTEMYITSYFKGIKPSLSEGEEKVLKKNFLEVVVLACKLRINSKLESKDYKECVAYHHRKK